jgi:broad specificity phosphatase PhoE
VSTIVLSRHGKPHCDYRTAIPGRAFADWRRNEENAPLDPLSRPGPELERLVRGASCVITSPLRRSLESARLLAASASLVTDARVREAELPSAFPSNVRLVPDVWAALARSAWFCGWSNGRESFTAARHRAREAARMLIARADAAGPVAVVGHGMMNILIARELRASGWHGPRIPSPWHWSFGVFRR